MDASPSRLPYADLGTPQEMSADCRVVAGTLKRADSPVGRRWERAVRAAVGSPPSLRFEDYPRERAKREIRIDEATARLAAALHLHLD